MKTRLKSTLPALPPPSVRVISENEAAARLSLSRRCLQEYRLRGTGPKFIRLGDRRIGYDLQDLADWISERRAASNSAPELVP
jgi:predicted DNA-binding transcriptional regulator AlpA